MNKNINYKKVGVILLIVLAVLGIGFGLYSHFDSDNSISKKENTNGNMQISSVYQIALNNVEQEFLLNGKKVSLKVLNNVLYVNGNKVEKVKADSAEITEQVIIFTYKGKCNDIISYVIDSDGESVPFTDNNYQLYDFRMLDGKCVAAGSDVCPCKRGTCVEKLDITFTYTGKELIIK